MGIEMDGIFGVFTDPRKYKIAVVGVGNGVGASFVAECFAWRMGKLVDGVSYLESETCLTTAGGRVPSDYMPPLTSALPPLPERPLWEEVRGRYIIVGEPEIERLAESSIVICIVDPLPSRVQSGAELASAIKENRIKIGRKLSPLLNLPTPVLWVINKDNEKVNHRLLERFLGVTFDFRLPLLDTRLFYAAEYSQQSITDELAAAAGKGDKAATEFIDELDRLAKKILASLP
jgi:hypothetical protein